jgi:hypothetical protein
MSELTDRELNKFLHEKVMGECWHDHINKDGICMRYGRGCGLDVFAARGQHFEYSDDDWEDFWPNYCHSLDAVRRVEEKLLADDPYNRFDERSFPNRYTDEIEKLCGDGVFKMVRATARQRAEACKNAFEVGT